MAARHWLFVCGLLLFAAALRLLGNSFGQPNAAVDRSRAPFPNPQLSIHPDEYFYVAIPFEMLVYDRWNPQFFENPSLLIYLNRLSFGLAAAQADISPQQLRAMDQRSAAPFYLYISGRVYSALVGLLAVAAAYAMGRSVGGLWAAIAAGSLVAVSYPLVQHAHYATTSSLAAGFTAVALLAMIRGLNRQSLRWMILAALCVGLAIGSRYNAAALGLALMLALLIVVWRGRLHPMLALMVLLIAPATFLLTTPFALLDFEAFWQQFSFIYGRFTFDESTVTPDAPPSLWLIIRFLGIFALGLPAMFLSLLGLIRLLRLRLDVALVLMSFVLPYSLVVLDTTQPQIADQLSILVIAPLCVLTSIGFVALLPYLRRPLWSFALVGLLLMPLSFSVIFVSLLRQPDTRSVMQTWVMQNLPMGSRVHLLGPYNVNLDPADFMLTQSFAGLLPRPMDLQLEGFDYVVFSDAWWFFTMRRDGLNPEYFQEVRGFLVELEQLPLLGKLLRPRWPGDDVMPNNGSYWHQPGLSVYCLNEAACRAVASR